MCDDFVPTRAALLKGNNSSDFKVVKYESYKAKPKSESLGPRIGSTVMTATNKKTDDKRKGIDIQRARREIIKFGMTGFSYKKQEEAKVALAVSLGAKPPKKECKNYKDLIEQNKRQKRLDKKYEAMRLGKSSHSVGVSKQKIVFNRMKPIGEKRKKEFDPLQIYGKPTLDTKSSATSTNTNRHFKKKQHNVGKKKR